jgi:predicted restriction endonuclease
MKAHLRIYLQDRRLNSDDFIACEVCGQSAVDIHHIQPRGMGGSKYRDTADNLIALCRVCHHEADFGTALPKDYLRKIVHDRKTT